MVLAVYTGFYLFGMLLARWHRSAGAAFRMGGLVVFAAALGTLTLWLLHWQDMVTPLTIAAFIGLTSLPALMLGLGLLAGGALKRAWHVSHAARLIAMALAALVPGALIALLIDSTFLH